MPKTWRWAGRPAACWGRDRRHGLRQTTNPFQELSVIRVSRRSNTSRVSPSNPHATTDRACTSNPTVLPVGCHCHHCQTIVNSQLSTMFC